MSAYSFNWQESQFQEAENNADEFLSQQPFCLEDILTEQARKDAKRINDGETTGKATDYVHNYLKRITEDPLLYCYHAGQRFWDFYIKTVKSLMKEDRLKIATFPEW